MSSPAGQQRRWCPSLSLSRSLSLLLPLSIFHFNPSSLLSSLVLSLSQVSLIFLIFLIVSKPWRISRLDSTTIPLQPPPPPLPPLSSSSHCSWQLLLLLHLLSCLIPSLCLRDQYWRSVPVYASRVVLLPGYQVILRLPGCPIATSSIVRPNSLANQRIFFYTTGSSSCSTPVCHTRETRTLPICFTISRETNVLTIAHLWWTPVYIHIR